MEFDTNRSSEQLGRRAQGEGRKEKGERKASGGFVNEARRPEDKQGRRRWSKMMRRITGKMWERGKEDANGERT